MNKRGESISLHRVGAINVYNSVNLCLKGDIK